MGKNGFVAVILIFALVSNTCNASLAFNLRKLITSEPNNGPATSQVSPIGSPVNESNAKPISVEQSPNENQTSNQNNNETPPVESKKNNNGNENSDAPSLPAGKNGDKIDGGNGNADNATTTKVDDHSSCEGSVTSCRDKEMLACIEASKASGSKEVFLVLQNSGGSTFKVNVNSPITLENAFPPLEVPKHETRKMDISSIIVGNSTELTVSSGDAKCVLHLVNPVSVDNLIQQLSFYSKQVNPIYAAYACFLLALLFGGTWACCKLRKRNSRQQDGIPYQELEMGLPESASAVNVDVAEGWDHDWDDDDWDEGNAVKSPSGNGVRSISADGLTIRSSKKDGWDD